MRPSAILRCALAAAALAALLSTQPAAGFYLPGVAPTDFAKVAFPLAST
jgi:transmembrane 9 superfamily protein 2/4